MKDIDYCEKNACKNGAQCYPLNTDRSYICNCQAGYYGLFCEFGKICRGTIN